MKKLIKSNIVAGILVFICFQLLILDNLVIRLTDFYLTNVDNACEWGALFIVLLLIARNAYLAIQYD